MKIKKLFFTLLFAASLFNIYASMSPGELSKSIEYFNNSWDVYVSDPEGIDVKESPRDSSATIIHLPQGTYVRIVKIHGPENNVRVWWDKESYYNSNCCAIFLPQSVRNENQIGWIPTVDFCLWWDDEKFDNSEWGSVQLESYLLNSLWEVEISNKSSGKTEYAAVEFEDNSICGYKINADDELNSINLGDYSVVDGKTIQIKNSRIIETGAKKLNTFKTSFSFDDVNNRYTFRKINLGSVLYMKMFEHTKNKEEKINKYWNFVSHSSTRYFRVYSRDDYNNRTIADYVDDDGSIETEKRLMLAMLAINYGMDIDLEYYKKILIKYWGPHLNACENELGKGTYYYNKFESIECHFVKNHQYFTNERLKLRSSADLGGAVIGVMDKNTVVEYLDCTELDCIDGAVSGWVKIRIIENPDNAAENHPKQGTVGYCFGAYLSDPH